MDTCPDGIPPIVLSKCASVLYRAFHYLFSLVLKYSYLPRDWKIHKIIPVFKFGDPTQVKNYRPISLLCNISKVLERIIYNKLINYVSWVHAKSIMFLSNVFTVHHQLDTIYLDISKAFDSICHTHLLQKLSMYNISGNLWLWFKNYLTNRFQFVSINNSYSHLLPVLSGVPQGSILGPLLFILYMNDLPDAIRWSRALLFADDNKCFSTLNPLMMSSPFKTTCKIYFHGVSNPNYLSIPPINQHLTTSEVTP